MVKARLERPMVDGQPAPRHFAEYGTTAGSGGLRVALVAIEKLTRQ